VWKTRSGRCGLALRALEVDRHRQIALMRHLGRGVDDAVREQVVRERRRVQLGDLDCRDPFNARDAIELFALHTPRRQTRRDDDEPSRSTRLDLERDEQVALPAAEYHGVFRMQDVAEQTEHPLLERERLTGTDRHDGHAHGTSSFWESPADAGESPASPGRANAHA
jgi:hypothetical protein